MQQRAQKTRKNLALKVAIIERDLPQREVAHRTHIGETRLSHIVHGRVEATEDEQRQLAKVLKRDLSDLFPFQEEASAL